MTENNKRFIPDKEFSDGEKDQDGTITLGIEYKKFLIDALGDDGEINDYVSIPIYYLEDSKGSHYPGTLNKNILEYLCGKKPVDVMDGINLKNYFIDDILYSDFPLKDTYYKNLKINKVEEC